MNPDWSGFYDSLVLAGYIISGTTKPVTISSVPWKSITSPKTSPECIFKCGECGRDSYMHPNYVKYGINPCVGQGKCNKIADTIPKMMEARGFKLIKIHPGSASSRVILEYQRPDCPDKPCTCNYETFRNGGCCRACANKALEKEKQEVVKIERPPCNCVGKPGCRPNSCIHYNHAICHPDSAAEWDYEANGNIRPENISPQSNKIFFWKCPNEWCNMTYDQSPNNRISQNQSCPYCSGHRVCPWNCLQSTHAELCEELDPENTIKATDVTYGSHIVLKWICRAVKDIVHQWEASVGARTSGRGCPDCNQNGQAQIIGGHQYFIDAARKIHGDRYGYPEPYRGIHVPIKISCSALVKNSNPQKIHGDFQQTPGNHKSGQGCPKCAREQTQSRGMSQLLDILNKLGFKMYVDFFPEIPFQGLFHQKSLRVDLYFPLFNFVIEYDGIQHFRCTFPGFDECKIRDTIKERFFLTNRINILRIPCSETNGAVISEMIMQSITLCKSGLHLYASFLHHIEDMKREIDLSRVFVITVPSPPRR